MKSLSPLIATLVAGAMLLTPSLQVQAQQAGPELVSTIVVFDPGAEPRRELRYQVTPGQSGTLIMEMRMVFGAGPVAESGAGSPSLIQTFELPLMRLTMSIAVTEVAADGTFRHDFSFDAFEVVDEGLVPAELRGIEQAMAPLIGVTGWSVLTDRGVLLESGFNLTPGADPQLARTLGDQAGLNAALPDEPVGVGARWIQTVVGSVDGLMQTTTTQYHLTAIDGDILTLEATLEQTAPPQPMQVPDLPAGAVATLDAMTSTGAWTATLDLRSFATTGVLDLRSETIISASAMGFTQTMRTTMDLALRILLADSPGR